jgi:hypothetical protein
MGIAPGASAVLDAAQKHSTAGMGWASGLGRRSLSSGAVRLYQIRRGRGRTGEEREVWRLHPIWRDRGQLQTLAPSLPLSDPFVECGTSSLETSAGVAGSQFDVGAPASALQHEALLMIAENWGTSKGISSLSLSLSLSLFLSLSLSMLGPLNHSLSLLFPYGTLAE